MASYSGAVLEALVPLQGLGRLAVPGQQEPLLPREPVPEGGVAHGLREGFGPRPRETPWLQQEAVRYQTAVQYKDVASSNPYVEAS